MNKLIIAEQEIDLDVAGMYRLNDLHKAAMAQGRANESQRPSIFFDVEANMEFARAVSENAGIPAFRSTRGRHGGTWAVELVAMKYAGWINPLYEVQVYQAMQALKRGDIHAAAEISGSKAAMAAVAITEAASFVEIVARSMNMSDSSKLGMFHRLEQKYGLDGLLPHYAIDSQFEDGIAATSSGVTKSLTEILKSSGSPISARVANLVLADAGIIERKERPSSKGGTKKFWSITELGMEYGKNVTSPNNPRETQPHFYESAASDLILIVTNANKDGV